MLGKDFKPNIQNIEDEKIVKSIASQLFEVSIHRVKREFESVHSENNFNLLKNSESGIEMSVSGKNQGDKYRVKNEEEIFPELSELEEELLLINVDKSKTESELKKLEAEIGPIKYIAEIVSDFGGPDVNAQSAVRIVILILIFVFDPLAILLVVAAASSFKEATGQALPKDVAAMRDRIIDDLEMHLAEGKPAESFVEKYKI